MSVDDAINALVEALKSEDQGEIAKVQLSDFGLDDVTVAIVPRTTTDAVLSILKRMKRF